MTPEAVATALCPSQTPAFRTLFEAELSYVFHALRRLGVREADLEDLTHDVFLVVYRRLSDYDPARPLRPWLFGIALRVASGYRQRSRFRQETADGEVDAVDPSVAADEQVATKELRKTLIEALDLLDDDRRTIFVMHEIDELSMPEIAAALSIPLATAYSRLRLARERLQGELASFVRARGET